VTEEQREPEHPFYQTRDVRVVWIPPRDRDRGWKRAFAALDIVAAVTVAALAVKFTVASDGAGVVTGANADSAAESANVELAAMSKPSTPRRPTGTVLEEAPRAVTVADSKVEAIPRDRDGLGREIRRCKDPAEDCTVDYVLRLGRELVNQRRVSASRPGR
jgi:hypothetical protein